MKSNEDDKMNKKKYITPEIKIYEIKDTDIIRVSSTETNTDDELQRATNNYFKGTSIESLFE